MATQEGTSRSSKGKAADIDEKTGSAPLPQAPTELSFDPQERAYKLYPAHLATGELDVPEAPTKAVTTEPVQVFRLAAGPGGVLLDLDGERAALDTQQALELKRDLDAAIAGLNY